LLVFQSIFQIPDVAQYQWDQLCAKEAVNGPQTMLQGKEGCMITVMDDWGQLHINATLLKPTKHYHSHFRAIQGHEKVIWEKQTWLSILFCCGV